MHFATDLFLTKSNNSEFSNICCFFSDKDNVKSSIFKVIGDFDRQINDGLVVGVALTDRRHMTDTDIITSWSCG